MQNTKLNNAKISEKTIFVSMENDVTSFTLTNLCLRSPSTFDKTLNLK